MEDLTNFDSKLTEAIWFKPNEYLDIVSKSFSFSLKKLVLKFTKCQCQMSLDFLQPFRFRSTLSRIQECWEIFSQVNWIKWSLFLVLLPPLLKLKLKHQRWLSNANIVVIRKSRKSILDLVGLCQIEDAIENYKKNVLLILISLFQTNVNTKIIRFSKFKKPQNLFQQEKCQDLL